MSSCFYPTAKRQRNIPTKCTILKPLCCQHGKPNANAPDPHYALAFRQVVRGKSLWRGKFKHKETMIVTRVDVSMS